LQDLDGQDWGEATYPSYVVTNVHRLRRAALQDFTVEDLRLMIGQGFSESLPYLVPLAVERLRENPLVSGDFYPGDLLKNVVGIGAPFWKQYPDLRRDVETIADHAVSLMSDYEDIPEFLADDIARAIEQFKQGSRK
jgi:hypothetical protein